MKLEYGLIDESFKYIYGNRDFDNSRLCFENKEIELVSAKGDWSSFQVVVRAKEDITVSISKNPYFNPLGTLSNVRINVTLPGLPDADIKMNFIGLMEDDDRLLKSDILLNQESLVVEKNKAQPVWVEISTPENCKPGKYTGKVEFYTHKMFDCEIKLGTLTFEIEVKNIVMPRPHEYTFYLDLWQHLSNIARKHEVVLWSEEHFKIIEEYLKTLAELGQKSITLIVSEIPWSGQRKMRCRNYLSDLFEYNIVRIEKDVNGQFKYDFSIAEKYIKLCIQYGISKEIELFGLINIWLAEEDGYTGIIEDYPDAVRIRYYDKSDGCYKYMYSKEELKAYIKALENFFIEKQWISIVRVVADEPSDEELYMSRLSFLKETAPSFKYKTAINHAEFIEKSKNLISDFAPILPAVFEKMDLIKDIIGNFKGRMLWYVCCNPDYPNTFIMSPLLESRLIGLLTAFLNFDGFLRWNYTAWPEKPREKIYLNYPKWKAGDTNFVYPAWNGKPLLSLRYKHLKRGIEDFELIQRVRQYHPDHKNILNTIWDRIFRFNDIKDFYTPAIDVNELYSLDYEDYVWVRKTLLEALEQVC